MRRQLGSKSAGLVVVALMAAVTPSSAQRNADLTQAAQIGKAGLCEVGRVGEAMFSRIAQAPNGRSRLTLIPGLRAIVMAKTSRLRGEATATVKTAVPTGPANWNGLPVSFIEVRYVSIPESHGPSARRLGLAVPMERLRSVLIARGIVVAELPATTRVEVEPYGASAWIERRGASSDIVCETND